MAAVLGIRAWPRPVVVVCATLLVAGCYYAAGRIGLSQQLTADGAVVTPIWPPTGLAVTCLLLFGPWCVPGIALGALLVILSLGVPDVESVGIVAGNTAAPVCAWLMLRAVGFRVSLSRLRDGLALVFLGALTAMLISSWAGVGMLVLSDKLPTDHLGIVWLAWWVGDAMGVVLVTPLLLLLYRARLPPPSMRWAEALGLTAAVCVLVPLIMYSSVSVLFLAYPILIWSVLRFQLAGGIPCALFVSVMATVVARQDAGSFGKLTDVETMMKLQAFNGTLGLTALLLSAVISEQLHTRRSVELACQELVEALQHLNAGGSGSPGPHERGVP
ncbi:MASE1 domain-containing protein [Streptomyces sp. NPDC058783]|uniref:MASE1 domain-containing protein n=1 Tax=Streptomyces TaxID=1883 RepID=UPI00210E53DD|nr:MASE1 domain-containing protein [Streptomyces coelicoflavus]MCQ4204168.1 MASE1 domain-containing protein [Streptomyces coelicoflavus]